MGKVKEKWGVRSPQSIDASRNRLKTMPPGGAGSAVPPLTAESIFHQPVALAAITTSPSTTKRHSKAHMVSEAYVIE